MITKHAGGRPTKYSSDILIKANEYINTCGREQTTLPTIEGLALYLDITSETVRQWERQYPELSLTIKKIEDKQKQQLIDDGMYGGKEVNSGMAIFLLKANHGMIETERRELVGKDGEPLSISFILGHEYIPTIRQVDGTPEGSAGNRSLSDGSEV